MQTCVGDSNSGAGILLKEVEGIRVCVSIKYFWVAALCLRRLLYLHSSESLMSLTLQKARSAVKDLTHALGLARPEFRWYGIQRRGATSQFRAHGQMERP